VTDFKERRNYPRVAVEGATVAYKKKDNLDFIRRYSSEFPMRDIAKGGICFEINNAMETGMTVELKLNVPGEKRLNIKGNIVWTANVTGNGRIFVGVRFLPFGKGKMYNSFECWDKLEQITNNQLADSIN
jgi:hypothetical protein